MKKILSLLLVLALALSAFSAFAEGTEAEVTEIEKHGNLVLSLAATELLKAGYEYGDIVTVTINGTAYDMPIGYNFNDVDQGSMICRAVIKPASNEDAVILAINMGDLATLSGIATKERTETDPGYIWKYNEGITVPVRVSIAMKEKDGYYDEFILHRLVRSENRADYPGLSDGEFANFRAITTTGISAGKFYRSSSPVNPEINRNAYADREAAAAGVKVFLNLADNAEEMRGYEGFGNTYYSTQAIIPLNLGLDFTTEEFRKGLAEGFRFIAAHEGPYLVHCTEGKDRAAFASAVLECLMGASADEVIADYMVTFYNFYGVQPGTGQYDVIAGRNICKSLETAFGVTDIREADLRAEAEAYLLEIGLSADEIAQIRARLGE